MARFSLRPWWNRMTPSPGSGRLAGRPSRQRTRLHLEWLEGRCVPTTVTNLNDAGMGSLRQAILDTPAGGTVDFQPGLSGTIGLTSGELLIDKDLTIAGPGADVITVSGNQASRVFDVAASVTVAIAGLTIADGNAGSNVGGGILSDGTLTVTDSTVARNFLSGIYNYGTLALITSTIRGNPAAGVVIVTGSLTMNNSVVSGNGSGVVIYTGSTIITDSTISGNASSGIAGSGGTLTVMNTTISHNIANRIGGGIRWLGDTMTIIGCTISDNVGGVLGGGGIAGNGLIINSTISGNRTMAGGGGGIQGGGILRNTIVAGNRSDSGPDVSGSFMSQGYNLIGDGSGGRGFVDSDLVGMSANPIDPLLGPLQDNGGPTQTVALSPGSPALNAGDPDQLGTADQRGVVRAGGVNIGAYQASAASFRLDAPAAVTAGVPFDLTVTALDPFGQVAVGYTGTVTFRTTDPDPGVVLPTDYPFTPGDGGVHTFTDTGLGETTLLTPGEQTLTVTDTADGTLTGAATVTVGSTAPEPGGRLPSHPGQSAAPVNAPSGSARPVPEVANADRFFAALIPEGSGSLWYPQHARGHEPGPWGLQWPGEPDPLAL
jgi:hypothetical protein